MRNLLALTEQSIPMHDGLMKSHLKVRDRLSAMVARWLVRLNTRPRSFLTMGPAVGWIGETEIRTQTAAPALDELAFPAMALYAMPAVTATRLEDSPANAQYI
ncbi:MAG: phage major capsid protein [Pseudolabrys sp.]|jgi:HK97 family phage major capsid protein